MKHNELISVLVPVYNVQNFIAKCAESLFRQTFGNIQYVFVNDASTDKSLQVLLQQIKKFPQRSGFVTIVNNEKNRGLSAARNIALAHALGKYIIHVDGDDFLELDAVYRLYERAKSKNAELVVGDFISDFPGHSEVYKHPKYRLKGNYLLDVIHRKVPCCVWGKLIRRDFLIKNKITSIDGVNFGEDFVVTVRMIDRAERIEFLDSVVYHYVRTNQQSITMNLSEKSIKDLLQVNEVLFDYFGIKSELSNQIKLYTKLLLLKQLTDKKLLIESATIYPNIENSCSISYIDRIILILAKYSCFAFLLFLCSNYKRVVRVFQKFVKN